MDKRELSDYSSDGMGQRISMTGFQENILMQKSLKKEMNFLEILMYLGSGQHGQGLVLISVTNGICTEIFPEEQGS